VHRFLFWCTATAVSETIAGCGKMSLLQIVTATPDRYTAITKLNRAAFGSDAEGALVIRLRDDGLVLAERIAFDVGEIVGHILFSRLGVEIEGRAVRATALAPMAVHPDRSAPGHWLPSGAGRLGRAAVHRM
jgi:hypothetical protein